MPPSRRRIPACAIVAFSFLTLALPILVLAQTAPSEPQQVPDRRMMRMSMPLVQSEGDSARVPGRKMNGMIVVPVEVNGQGPFWFAIDTGAMGHARVNDPLAARLGLAVAGKAMAVDPSGKHPRDVTLYRIDSLRIG